MSIQAGAHIAGFDPPPSPGCLCCSGLRAHNSTGSSCKLPTTCHVHVCFPAGQAHAVLSFCTLVHSPAHLPAACRAYQGPLLVQLYHGQALTACLPEFPAPAPVTCFARSFASSSAHAAQPALACMPLALHWSCCCQGCCCCLPWGCDVLDSCVTGRCRHEG